jgi:hypothetical protein
LEHEVNTKVELGSRIMIGPHVSINQEFRLTPRMYFHLNLNFMAQANITSSEGYSVGWGGVTVQTGLYWYLKTKKKDSL